MFIRSVFACILDEKGEKLFEKRYGTLTPNLTELRDKLVEKGYGRVAVENTSICWMPIWRITADNTGLFFLPDAESQHAYSNQKR